jgi:hypothetical protein
MVDDTLQSNPLIMIIRISKQLIAFDYATVQSHPIIAREKYNEKIFNLAERL